MEICTQCGTIFNDADVEAIKAHKCQPPAIGTKLEHMSQVVSV